MERIAGEADLRRTLGTLRYLTSLQAEHLAAGRSQPAPAASSKPDPDVKPAERDASSSTRADSIPAPAAKAESSSQVRKGAQAKLLASSCHVYPSMHLSPCSWPGCVIVAQTP